MPDPRLEEFIALLGRRLAGLPRQVREEELDEVRLHLDALIEEYRSEGLSRDAAVTAAIDRFGSADRVGRGLASARRRRQVSGYLQMLVFMSVGGIPAYLATWAVLGGVLDAEPFRWSEALPRALWLVFTTTVVFVAFDLWRRRRRSRDLNTALDAFLRHATASWRLGEPDAPEQHKPTN
jgi:hypothetical protein